MPSYRVGQRCFFGNTLREVGEIIPLPQGTDVPEFFELVPDLPPAEQVAETNEDEMVLVQRRAERARQRIQEARREQYNLLLSATGCTPAEAIVQVWGAVGEDPPADLKALLAEPSSSLGAPADPPPGPGDNPPVEPPAPPTVPVVEVTQVEPPGSPDEI